jgi:hypothetical protein
MALITTPGASDANSYVSVAEASEYFSLSYNRTAWANASNRDKEKSLAEATRLLDLFVKWNGYIASISQRLRWPRINVIDADGRVVDSGTIPQAIKNATCELAYSILSNDGFDISENPIDKVKVGPISVDFDINQKSIGFPKIVRDIIASWGDLQIQPSSGLQTAKLVRT